MMKEETAKVLRLDGDFAVILRERINLCVLCPDPDECEESQLEECGIEIRARNRAGAQVGDTVIVKLEGGTLLAAVALVYGIPMAFMALGLYLGVQAASSMGMAALAAQGLGASGLVVALLLSIPISRQLNKGLHRLEAFMPVIHDVQRPGFEV